MSYTSPTRTKRRVLAMTIVGAALAVGATAVIVFSPWTAGAATPGATSGTASGPAAESQDTGVLPEGATIFDSEHSGISGLEANLVSALENATTDAAASGIVINVTSGWRSHDYQDQLLSDAITLYGSEEEARRWVATSATSPHVSGDAVDVGGYDAMDWLDENGSEYNLCRIYDNEAWHFELRADASTHGCPSMYWDPTYDPRMQS